ncbi:hypothetical protein [Fundidesulfovibrio soli]|uniref:hypothetical protein n=1 Tax=Fundidesulfovibrio soli TaxID=2922716 RepID=UPI001FAEE45D|nr:hypothetical protein [Fundidesulfovibrio soli]
MAKEKNKGDGQSPGETILKIVNPSTGTPTHFAYSAKSLAISHDGEVIGQTIPLARVEDVAKRIGVHRMAIPIHMIEHDLPVYSIGSDDFINMEDLKFLIEEIGFSFW